ncbi:MAG: NAD(P)-dependent oxidoreductase [Rhodospirillales bacterium]|nr:NAD(P)-dependent oxidoreductase [Rhodospirillales bacterium]
MATAVGFAGLGNMGQAMARRLLEAGFDVSVYNRTPEKAEPLLAAGARSAATPEGCVAGDGVVMTMLADDRALDNVVFGEHGLMDRLGPGGLHVSLSTISPQSARRIAIAHSERGAGYLAVPVFGRPEAAAAGKLWAVTSGPAAAKERVRAMLAAFAQGSFDFGDDIGAANTVKLAGNFLILSAMEALAEAFAMVEKRGISRSRLAELLTTTLFDCPAYRTYAPMIAEHRHSPAAFSLSLGLKDIRLVLAAADAAGAPMPLANLLHDRLLSLQSRGHGELDWSALALAASRDAGLD